MMLLEFIGWKEAARLMRRAGETILQKFVTLRF